VSSTETIVAKEAYKGTLSQEQRRAEANSGRHKGSVLGPIAVYWRQRKDEFCWRSGYRWEFRPLAGCPHPNPFSTEPFEDRYNPTVSSR
jgi:hypothetical protein